VSSLFLTLRKLKISIKEKCFKEASHKLLNITWQWQGPQFLAVYPATTFLPAKNEARKSGVAAALAANLKRVGVL